MRVVVGKVVPGNVNDLSALIQLHFTVFDISKQMQTILDHYRDKIRPRLGIIIAFQADRSPAAPFGTGFPDMPPFDYCTVNSFEPILVPSS